MVTSSNRPLGNRRVSSGCSKRLRMTSGADAGMSPRLPPNGSPLRRLCPLAFENWCPRTAIWGRVTLDGEGGGRPGTERERASLAKFLAACHPAAHEAPSVAAYRPRPGTCKATAVETAVGKGFLDGIVAEHF